MYSEQQRSAVRVREVDDTSTLLLRVGVSAVKRHPGKAALYVLGLILCLFFNGFAVNEQSRAAFYQSLGQIDHAALDDAQFAASQAYKDYRRSSGWWSCDKSCQFYKEQYEINQRRADELKRKQQLLLADAKGQLGIFSEYGVSETRDLFWRRFSQGKGFATRQSQWDALFMGISAMGRDEGLASYLVRLSVTVLFNLTLGVCGALIAFWFSLPGLLQSYGTSWLTGTCFFGLAGLAALSYVLSWLLGLYLLSAGAAYVTLRFAASNMRLEDDPRRSARTHRVH
eukprot:gene34355-41585_t